MSKEPFEGGVSPQLISPPPIAAPLKYARSVLLSLYIPSALPASLSETGGDLAAVLSEGQPPVLNAAEAFPRPLGEDPSFRPHLKERRAEVVPEWFQGPSSHSTATSSRMSPPSQTSPAGKEPKPKNKEARPVRVRLTDGSRNVPSDIQLAGSDVIRPSQKPADDPSSIPDSKPRLNPDAQPWSGSYIDSRLPLYHITVLKEKTQRGDPFAAILLESGVIDSCGFMGQPSGSKASEKVWYYKDPHGLTQGPFSSVEMFNWHAAGYFALDLPLALGPKAHFYPLASYMKRVLPPKREKEEDVSASNELKMMLGVGAEEEAAGSGCRG